MRLQIHSRLLVGILAATFCLPGASCLEAQSAGSKDFSQPPAAITAQGNPTQPKFCEEPGAGTHSDGISIEARDPVLTLSITGAKFLTVDHKPYIEMTVILKNDGIGSAVLPWSDSPVAPARLSPIANPGEVGYRVATVEFFAGEPFGDETDLRLRSPVALWSQPDNEVQSIRIAAGQWLALHVRAEITCMSGDSAGCLRTLRESKLQVSGWWYQRLLTETYKGSCIYSSGAYTERELDSRAVAVAGTPYQSSEYLMFNAASAPHQ